MKNKFNGVCNFLFDLDGTREELDAAGPDHMVNHSLEILELLNAS